MHIEELLCSIDKIHATQDQGRGIENIPTCPTCNRATVLLEHEYTPQLTLIRDNDEEPDSERRYFTCEWCGAVIDPKDVSERAARKPAGRAGEDELEWLRRTA